MLRPHLSRTVPTSPPTTTHLGLSGDVPDLAPETVFHGDTSLVVRTGGQAPEGRHAWTLHTRGGGDPLRLLAAHGVVVEVDVRVDRSPGEVARTGSPDGVRWRGRRTISDRLGPRTPIQGVYAAGAHATPGGGLPFVGLSAALVAQAIGPAR